MASRVTNEDIIHINELYYKYKTYAEVARQTGFAASTVKKYVIPGWQPVLETKIIRFNMSDLPDSPHPGFVGLNNYGELCVLTSDEKEELKGLWEEMAV